MPIIKEYTHTFLHLRIYGTSQRLTVAFITTDQESVLLEGLMTIHMYFTHNNFTHAVTF